MAYEEIITSVGKGVRKDTSNKPITKKGFSSGQKEGLGSLGEAFKMFGGGGDSGESTNVELHPMAQKAASLDMGFYGHMKPSAINKGKPIMGGINGATRKGK